MSKRDHSRKEQAHNFPQLEQSGLLPVHAKRFPDLRMSKRTTDLTNNHSDLNWVNLVWTGTQVYRVWKKN